MFYFPIRIGTIRISHPISFDIFILIHDRYIHYVRKYDVVDNSLIKKLVTRGVRKVYIPADQEPQYLNYLEVALEQLVDSPLTSSEKGVIANDLLVTEAENVSRSLESETGYQKTRNRVKKIVEFLTAENGAVKNILESAGVSTDYCQHSANVSTLSLGMAIKFGIDHHQELLDLAIAGLIHDIGRSKLGFDSDVPRSSLSSFEFEEYKKHPQLGVDLIADKRYVTPRILRLVADHEETDGKFGFPEGKKFAHLPTTSQILNVANEYDRFYSFSQEPTSEAINNFISEKADQFPYYHLTQLKNILLSSED